MSVRIPLTMGYFALVDEADLAAAEAVRWRANVRHVRGRVAVYAMSSASKPKRTLYLHRLLLNALPGQYVDHVNHDTLDCRRCNIRLCEPRENSANSRRAPNSSGFRGVRKHRSKFQAFVFKDCRHVILGSFDTAQEAARVRDRAAVIAYGEFAKLNFPDERPT